MKRTARFTAVAAVAAVAIGLAGCATGTASNSDSTDYGSGAKLSGKLNISGFTSTTDEIASTRYKLAVAADAGVTVKSDETGFDMQTFLSAVAGGSAPDLVYVDRSLVGTLAAKGAIEPLTSCISGAGIDQGSFQKAALDASSLNGTVYGIPEFSSADVVIADTDLMSKAGVKISDIDGSNRDALASAAQKMAVVNGGKVDVLGYDSKLPEFFPLWSKAFGADILSADGKKANLNDPKAIAALQYAYDIYKNEGGYSAVKAAKDASDFFGKGNQYATNTLGGMPMEQWYVNVLTDVSPSAALAFTTFKNTAGKTVSFSTGSAWAIPTGSKNKAAACRFAKTMTQTSTWIKAAQARIDKYRSTNSVFTGLQTANTQADAKIKAMIPSDVPAKWEPAIKAIYAGTAAGFEIPGNPAGSEFQTAWTDAVNRVLTGAETPKQSLDQAQAEAQKALDTAWKKVK